MSGERLIVLCGSDLVGLLERRADGQLVFAYAPSFLASRAAFAISLSLPLQEAAFADERAGRFFANLLPEGRLRALVARRLGISADNDFALLAAVGGECAGALCVLPESAASEDRPRGGYRRLSAEELSEMAASGAALPLAIGDGRSRLSLAGAQDKLPVLVEGEAILLPEGDAPSSHILKLPNRDFAHLPANEVLVSMLARAVGLRVPDARLVALGQERACLVRRYDRRRGDDGKLVRIHQEDLCQALGLGHATKYEQEGGPSLVDCFELVSRASAEPLTDCEQLLRWQAFNAAVGNADGHAKNLSLVLEGRIIRLAPFYDLVCTRAYPGLDRRLAMRVGEVADPGQIRGRDWSRLADAIGVGRRYLLDLVREMVGSVRASLDESAEDFREHYGDSPAVQMVVGAVRAQALRLSEQLSVD